MKVKSQSGGYAAISIILLLLVVTISIASTYSLLSIGEGQSSLALTKGEETLNFVEGCVEDALQKAHDSASYNGGSNITRPEGTCTISPITKVGNQWTFTVSTQATDYKRTIEIVINRAPPAIDLISWKEK